MAAARRRRRAARRAHRRGAQARLQVARDLRAATGGRVLSRPGLRRRRKGAADRGLASPGDAQAAAVSRRYGRLSIPAVTNAMASAMRQSTAQRVTPLSARKCTGVETIAAMKET